MLMLMTGGSLLLPDPSQLRYTLPHRIINGLTVSLVHTRESTFWVSSQIFITGSIDRSIGGEIKRCRIVENSLNCFDSDSESASAAMDGAETTKSISDSSYWLILTNTPLVSALVAFGVAQAIKFFTTWYRERRWDIKLLIGSGGMPSSHAATVIALAFAIGFRDGFGGSLFAIAMVLACVVMYDASGVRLHAGRQAEVLNQIVFELPTEHPLSEIRPLRELLGHTPPQVIAGGLLGLIISIIGHLINKAGTQV